MNPLWVKEGCIQQYQKKNNVYLSSKLLDFLQYSDGKNDLKSISKLIKLNVEETQKCFKILLKHNLIEI